MMALSIRQPWAWAILHAGKDIENRDWPTRFRGKFFLHASKGCTHAEYDDASDSIFAITRNVVDALPSLDRGGIIGAAEIVDCVEHSDSPWFFGRFGFVLRNVKSLRFTPCRGMLGFFTLQEIANG